MRPGALGGGLAGAGLLGVDPAAPGRGERVVLQLRVLRVGGDAGEPDQGPVAVREVETVKAGAAALCAIPLVSQNRLITSLSLGHVSRRVLEQRSCSQGNVGSRLRIGRI